MLACLFSFNQGNATTPDFKQEEQFLIRKQSFILITIVNVHNVPPSLTPYHQCVEFYPELGTNKYF